MSDFPRINLCRKSMNAMLIRGAVLLMLAALVVLAVDEAKKPDLPGYSESGGVEAGGEGQAVLPAGKYRNQVTLFTYLIFIAVTGGVMVLKWIVPAIGERVAETFYSHPDAGGQTPLQKAAALVAQGEYEKALAAYRRILEETPGERMAVAEMVRIHQDRLGDVEGAVAVLEEALAGTWPEDDRCFFLMRLADLEATVRKNSGRARELLQRVQREFPGSRHASNATHRLREIDEAEFLSRNRPLL